MFINEHVSEQRCFIRFLSYEARHKINDLQLKKIIKKFIFFEITYLKLLILKRVCEYVRTQQSHLHKDR